MTFVNGDFETGDLTGWDDSESTGGTVEVVEAAAHTGTYGLRLKGDIVNPDNDSVELTQDCTIYFDEISFWYKVNDLSGSATPNCYVALYGHTSTGFWVTIAMVSNPPEGDWINIAKTKSQITVENEMDPEDWGTGTMKLYFENNTASTSAGDVSFDVFLDDVIITETSGSTIPKSLGFRIKSTPPAIQKSLGFLIVTPVPLTKSLGFVIGTSSITPSTYTYIKGVKVRHSAGDTTATATVDYDTALLGGYASDIFFVRRIITIPDYSKTERMVFIGFYPSQDATYAPAADTESFGAVDYGDYLNNRKLNPADLILLTPADQALVTKHELQYDGIVTDFEVGQVVQGGTTGDFGLIIAVEFTVYHSIIIQNVQYGPGRTSGDYFQDDEELIVSGDTMAIADGHAVDVTGTIDIVTPADWVRNILGGANNWNTETGIEPYRLNPTGTGSGLWTPVDDIEFDFEATQTRRSALDRLAKHYNFIALIKWRWRTSGSTGFWQPCVFFVHQDDIDNPDDFWSSDHYGLQLPAAVSITAPDTYLVPPVKYNGCGNQQYNYVRIKCRALNGTWYTAVAKSDGLQAGTERPREYPGLIQEDLITQEDLNDRAAEILAYHQNKVSTWTATFNRRSDFQNLQKLIFSGYGSEIPNGTYRIISIDYDFRAERDHLVNQQTVTLVPESQFRAQLKLNRVFIDSLHLAKAYIAAYEAKKAKNIPGTIIAITDEDVTYVDEDGQVRHGVDVS